MERSFSLVGLKPGISPIRGAELPVGMRSVPAIPSVWLNAAKPFIGPVEMGLAAPDLEDLPVDAGCCFSPSSAKPAVLDFRRSFRMSQLPLPALFLLSFVILNGATVWLDWLDASQSQMA